MGPRTLPGAVAGSESEYVIAIKRSARRTSGQAGEWVNRRGTRRRFASKALAREWARRIDDRCRGGRVWVQDAPPHAGDDVDGYLVGARSPTGEGSPAGRGEQADLAEF